MKTNAKRLTIILIASLPVLAGCDANLYPEMQDEAVEVPIVLTTPCALDDAQCNMINRLTHFEFMKIRTRDDQFAAGSGFVHPQVRLRGGEDSKQPEMDPVTGRLPVIDTRFWQASLMPGTYAFDITPIGDVYLKSAVSGATDLKEEMLVVRPGVQPEPIEVALGKGASIEGATTKNGSPVPAGIFDLHENWVASVTSVNPPHPDGKFVFHMDGRAPGDHFICAVSMADISKLPHTELDPKIRDWCENAKKTVVLQEGQTTHLDLEVIDVPPETEANPADDENPPASI